MYSYVLQTSAQVYTIHYLDNTTILILTLLSFENERMGIGLFLMCTKVKLRVRIL